MRIRGIVAVLLFASLLPASVRAEGVQSSVAVYYPGVPWYLRYELDGVLEEYNNHKAGHSTYTMARSEKSGILVSVQISASNGARTALDCRAQEEKHIRQHKAFGNAKVQLSEAAGVDMEVLVPLGGPETVSRHVHRFWLRDRACAKIHASKTPFAERDRAGFDKVLDSVQFEPVGATFERAFVIPGRGTLLVSMPVAWGFRTSKPDAAKPRDIQFMEPDGDYQLLLTLFAEAKPVLKGDPTARAFVEFARESARANAVEPDPQVLEMKGSGGAGLYFFVTDKNLVGKPKKAADWKYLRQGAILMGESLLFFSMFSNAKESPVVDGALRAISEARLIPPPR
jgi:hypothetical protein